MTFMCGICVFSSETGAEPSLQATQMRLKRARLADNLNEMLAQRPGPMELVEKNILPVDSSVKQAIIGERRGSSDDKTANVAILDSLCFYSIPCLNETCQQKKSLFDRPCRELERNNDKSCVLLAKRYKKH